MRYLSTLLIPAAIFVAASLAPALELKDVTYTTTDAGKVVFSHKTHLQKKSRTTPNFSCKACHDSSHEKSTHAAMADMEKGKSCGACHNGKQAFALAKCTQCHKVREITYKVKETGPVAFSHTRHLRGMQCNDCHNRLFKTGGSASVAMTAMEKGKSCGACHNSKDAFPVKDCSKCHPIRDVVFEDKTLGDVMFRHNNHTGLYTCVDCHTSIYKTTRSKVKVSMQEMEKGKSCGACHDGKTAFTVKEQCKSCHQILSKP